MVDAQHVGDMAIVMPKDGGPHLHTDEEDKMGEEQALRFPYTGEIGGG